MGVEQSVPITATGALRNALIECDQMYSHMSMCFRGDDVLRLVNSDAAAVAAVRRACLRAWSYGLHKQQQKLSTAFVLDVRLNGQPFKSPCLQQIKTSSLESIKLLRLLCAILEELLAVGWTPVICTNIEQLNRLTTVFFRRETDSALCRLRAESQHVICIKITHDELALINAGRHLTTLVTITREFIEEFWTEGLCDELNYAEDCCPGGVHSFHLKGNPFTRDIGIGMQNMSRSRQLILSILQFLFQHNWTLIAVIDPFSPGMMGSLFLRRDCATIHHRDDLKDNCKCETQPSTPRLSIPHIKHDNMKSQLFLIEPRSNLTEDMLCLNGADKDVITAVRHVWQEYWQPGIRSEKGRDLTYHFKLRGQPWQVCRQRHTEQVIAEAHLAVLHMIETLRWRGWTAVAAIDLTRGSDAASSLLFERCPAEDKHFFGITLGPLHAITLLGTTTDMITFVRNILRLWPKGIESDASSHVKAHTFKLRGTPLTPSVNARQIKSSKSSPRASAGALGIVAALSAVASGSAIEFNDSNASDNCLFLGIFCLLLAKLWNLGWKPVLSADLSTHYDFEKNLPSDFGVIFFSKDD